MNQIIKGEVRAMCSLKNKSILYGESEEDLKLFTWDKLMTELESCAPNLKSILFACTETKALKRNRLATVGMCIAILLKFRFSRINLIQKINSLILYAGHSGKMVCII